MKVFLFLTLCFLTVPAFAQERVRHFQTFEPQFYELPDAHVAAGIAQAPNGYPVPLSTEPLPPGSKVGIYGQYLLRNQVRLLILHSDKQEWVIEADVFPFLFKIEAALFRLPADAHGELWVQAVGASNSNTVRIFVQ